MSDPKHNSLSAQDFMTSFAKEIVHNVDTRPQIVQEWTEKLETREAEMGRHFYLQFEAELHKQSPISEEQQQTWDRGEILEAAKIAAGIEDEH